MALIQKEWGAMVTDNVAFKAVFQASVNRHANVIGQAFSGAEKRHVAQLRTQPQAHHWPSWALSEKLLLS